MLCVVGSQKSEVKSPCLVGKVLGHFEICI